MPDDSGNLLALLNYKKNLLDEILRITRKTVITPSEESGKEDVDKACEEYIDLYSKRESLFSKVYELDNKINRIPQVNRYDVSRENAITFIRNQIKEIAKNIFLLDSNNSILSQKLSAHIKQSLKKLNDGKITRSKYNYNYEPTGVYHSLYDFKQ